MTYSKNTTKGPEVQAFEIGEHEITLETFEHFEQILYKTNTPDEAYAKYGTKVLTDILQKSSPNLTETVISNKNKLDTECGLIVIKETGIDKVSKELAQLGSIAVSSLLGSPTPTTPRSPVIAWPITYKPESRSSHKTFSETNSEASFHTDSQYLDHPEKYFGLFCIKPDKFGDGISQVVDGNSIIHNLSKSHGKSVIDELRKKYPFKLPSIFTKDDQELEPEVIWAPILSNNQIRYRNDTLMGALALESITVPDTQLQALQSFEEVLQKSDVINYSLEAGDVMFVNNHRMLHGRTAFQDVNRLLYRVRMD